MSRCLSVYFGQLGAHQCKEEYGHEGYHAADRGEPYLFGYQKDWITWTDQDAQDSFAWAINGGWR